MILKWLINAFMCIDRVEDIKESMIVEASNICIFLSIGFQSNRNNRVRNNRVLN